MSSKVGNTAKRRIRKPLKKTPATVIAAGVM
jgi:hypothetical protein